MDVFAAVNDRGYNIELKICGPAARLAQRVLNGTLLGTKKLGGVVEWLMAPVLKTGRAQALVGSNPTPSAKRNE